MVGCTCLKPVVLIGSMPVCWCIPEGIVVCIWVLAVAPPAPKGTGKDIGGCTMVGMDSGGCTMVEEGGLGGALIGKDA